MTGVVKWCLVAGEPIIDLSKEPLPKPVILPYNSYANVVNKGNPAIHLLDTDEQ